jgi:hypothetical protein
MDAQLKAMGKGNMSGGGDAALMNELKGFGGVGPEMDNELADLENMADMDEDESEEAMLKALNKLVPYDEYAATKL